MIDIELELKIDEMMKRLQRAEDNVAYVKFLKENKKEYEGSKKGEDVYHIFDYSRYEFRYVFASDLLYNLDPPQVIILGAFPAILLTDEPVHIS